LRHARSIDCVQDGRRRGHAQEWTVATSRRIGTEKSATRLAILDATERLMIDDGYAAVSTRKVAAAVALTPALVHYYFPTTDDLLLAVYRRAAEHHLERVGAALASAQPLHALWALSIDPARTVLAAEFMALANHRKTIGAEIARNIERSRALQTEAFAHALAASGIGLDPDAAAGLSFLMAGASRALVMERGLGIRAGHDEARALVESWLQRVAPPAGKPAKPAASRRRTRA
jgi:AcrR family transcriptional regulator